MSSQAQKVALVTGSSRGIGAAIATQLADDGFAVVINYSSSADAANSLVDSLEQKGQTAIAIKTDVSKPDQVKAMFDEIESRLGTIDVLVNNAGIMKNTTIEEASDEVFEMCFAINTQGVFNTLREASTRLNEGGRIINLSTSSLGLDIPGYAIYSGTKAAVEAFTRVFAKELRGKDILVNAVAPGPIATDLFLDGKSDDVIDNFKSKSPLERLGEPEDIAHVVSFLASQKNTWVNGQIVRTNGGII